MYLIYSSRTNNIERIVKKLNLINVQKIITGEEIFEQPFLLLTYTDYLGQVPEIVQKFLKKNKDFLRGVAGSGNKNFGNNFCKAAKIISDEFNVPLLMEFDLAGNEQNISCFKEQLLLSGAF